ncbi:MAG: MFS transporter [Rikenellaceae bacterium]|nr:MFS transporter [Rikenellaceae bacterium]
MNINTGKGTIHATALVAIWSISAVVSLPGLAISPILEKLDTIFPTASQLEVEMLESLPSLMIIPFMLLAGRWSMRGNKIAMLTLGCAIFLLSGLGSLLARSLMELILLGALMGIGAGIIIPLSTGFIVDYFTGDIRLRQLGISSAINNLTLVLATVLTGYLADIEWHFAFAVYLLPAVTLILIPALSHSKPMPEPEEGAQHRQKRMNLGVIIGLMLFYFVITYCSLVVTFNTSYLAVGNDMHSSTAGIVISLFFIAIMAPGFILGDIVRLLGNKVNLCSLVVMAIGLGIMSLSRPTEITLSLGAILSGLGYGVMQPIIYDKAATNAPPHLATLALSIVMAVNYLAILVSPFIIDIIGRIFDSESHTLAFTANAIITLTLAVVTALLYRSNRVLGSDD